jgi:hypothetical protein
MPWSVFFAPGGIALHAGDPANASAGCVHLPPADAEAFYNDLQVGDRVEVSESLGEVKGGFYGVNGDDGDDSSEDDGDDGDDSSDDGDDGGDDDE